MTPNLLDELEGVVRLMDVANAADIFDTFDAVDDFQAAAVNFLRAHAPALADMAKRLEASERDSKRLDWLSDPNQCSGQVLLPTASVEANLHDMRAAIDHAMNAAIDATQEGEG